MAPEYGATIGFFPIDDETLELPAPHRPLARDASLWSRPTRKEQGLFRTATRPTRCFSDTLELDLSTVEPCLAGPARPQDRVPLTDMKTSFPKQREGRRSRCGDG